MSAFRPPFASLLIRLSLLAIFLPGCAFFSTEARIEKMMTETTIEDVRSNLEWSIEKRLKSGETDEPQLIARLMEACVVIANRADLSNKDPEMFNRLTEALVNMVYSPPRADDPEDWQELQLPIDETRDYLSSYAAYQIGNLEGPAISEQLLAILRKSRSVGVRTMAIRGMLENMDAYTVNIESRAQAFTALAVANSSLKERSRAFASAFNAAEEKIVNHEVINQVLANASLYRLDDAALNYVLNINERLWNYYLSKNASFNFELLQENARALATLALPQVKQHDGKVPTFSKPQQRAQQMLLAYTPGLYYFSMLQNAKISDYSFGQLLATMTYMDENDALASKNPDELVMVNKEGRKIFNHQKLMNTTIYQKNRKKAAGYILKNLARRVDRNTPEYRDYIYSYLLKLFPQSFSDHLNKALNLPYRDAITDQQQVFYALNLYHNKDVNEASRNSLLDKVDRRLIIRSASYSADDYKRYADKIYPYLLKIDASRFVATLNSRSANTKKIQQPLSLAEYYIKGMETISFNEQGGRLTMAGALLGLHNKQVSSLVSAYLQSRNTAENMVLFEKYVFARPSQATSDDYLIFGNAINKRYKELNQNLKKRAVTIYTKGIGQSKTEETALRASQQALAFTQGRGQANVIAKSIKARWKQMNVPVL